MTTLLMLLRKLMPATFLLWFMLAGIVVAFASAALVDIHLQPRQLIQAGSIIGIIIVGIAAWTVLLTRRGGGYSRNN